MTSSRQKAARSSLARMLVVPTGANASGTNGVWIPPFIECFMQPTNV
ncbi:hypothetical protein [uncultured Methylobacterium sp.]|nr:hypothetical protein [uncultured Methylobacterium sp.]